LRPGRRALVPRQDLETLDEQLARVVARLRARNARDEVLRQAFQKWAYLPDGKGDGDLIYALECWVTGGGR
jgi:hypothetical protein